MNYSDSEYYGNRIDRGEDVERAVRLLPKLGPALFGTIAHLAQAHRMTPAQMKVLLQVGLHGRMTMGEIACGLAVSMPATSEVVDRLVESGHLVRASDPSDRRRVVIVPTPAGLRINEEVNALRRAQVRDALDRLAPEERPVFVRALDALLQGLTSTGDIEATPCPADAAEGTSPAASAARPMATVSVNGDHSG